MSRREIVSSFLRTFTLLSVACGDGGSTSPADASADADSDGDASIDGGDTDSDTGPGDTAVWVAAGYTQTCAVIDGGYVKCWGFGHFGELGYGNDLEFVEGANTTRPSTLPFVRVGGEVAQIDAGINTTCALLDDGGFKCWGYFGYSDLGVQIPFENNGTIGDIDVPADYAPVTLDAPVVQVDVGGGQLCVVTESGGTQCFGAISEIHFDDAVAHVCSGSDHSCAVLESGEVYCFGEGQYGALGYGNTEDVGDDETPASVGPVDVGGAVAQIACGYTHTCAVRESGDVVCWGQGDYGQLGYGNTLSIGDDETPASVGKVDVGAGVQSITAGNHFTCALLVDGGVMCWGIGKAALGYGSLEWIGDDETPASVGTVNLGGAASMIDAGMAHVCALMESGSLRCWGDASYGRLGYGLSEDVGDDETPAEMGDVELF